MGTKNNPGYYDCYEKAAPDEPLFVLRAKDPLAPILVRLWASLNIDIAALGSHTLPKLYEAQRCADDMEVWKANHG